MPRDREHLALQKWQDPLLRRKKGGGRPPERDRNLHGQELIRESETLAERFEERRRLAPPGINPKYIFKLRINRRGNLDLQQLETLGLHFLGLDENKIFVVFPDDETLSDVRARLREYSGLVVDGHKYNELANIEAIEEISPEDRVGRRLRDRPFLEDEVSNVDIELWYNTRDECNQKIREISEYLQAFNLRVTDRYIGTSICLLRARVNYDVLSVLLTFDYIKEIDRRPTPSFEMLDTVRLGVDQIKVSENLEKNAPGVLIIDSGIMQGHPLLRFMVGDAQVFPDTLRQRIQGGPQDGDVRCGGHGTAVAGIAGYGDIGHCITNRQFIPEVRLFSARVTDQNNEYDPDELIEHQISDAVGYFLENYPMIKVVNISLGDETQFYQDGFYQFRLAAVIDDLAFQYQDRNIIFVVSSGNYNPDDLDDEEIVRNYPSYLLNTPAARIIDPATSALAITVGGLAYGPGLAVQHDQENDIQRLVAQNRDWPSPFTRVGWGINGAVKPELVEYAGDWAFNRGRLNNRFGMQPGIAGIQTTAKDFILGGSLFRTVSGTSFSAPRVANLAAKLFKEFPDASSNLIKALIINSAQIPKSIPPCFENLEASNEDILRTYGYGQPSFDAAKRSEQNDVCLLADDHLEIGYFRVYEVPSLPLFYLQTNGEKTISVTLVFDPITRHTRGDSYLGVSLAFYLYKNISPVELTNAFASLSEEERENVEENEIIGLTHIERNRIKLKPGVNKLKKGTIQKATYTFTQGGRWQYNALPMYLVVTSARKWAPADVAIQRYAVVVSIKHDDSNVDLYSDIRQNTRLYQQARIQLNV